MAEDLTARQRGQLAEALHDIDCADQCTTWPCDIAPIYYERAKALAPAVASIRNAAASVALPTGHFGTGVYAEIAAERQRAHALHGPTSMESSPAGSFIRYTILAEEVGEVAKEFNEAEARGGQHTLNLSRIRAECIQVAAMAAAWADRLMSVLEESE